jgi:hypothetical protein
MESKKAWIYVGDGAKLLGVHKNTFKKIAESAGVRRQVFPGMKIARYFREDVEKIVRESVIDPGQAARVAS